MKAFHEQETIKATYLARVRAHRAADELVKGTYWQNGKGCAVGCTVHSARHAAYEEELGIPRALARLEDAIFEWLPNGRAKAWPEEFLEAIGVGVDLAGVVDRFLLWLLSDPKDGVLQYVKDEGCRAAIATVIGLYERRVRGESVRKEEWRSAYAAAYAAAASSAAAAAYDAAYAAADAAYDAAAADDADDSSAADAAYAADDAYDAAAADYADDSSAADAAYAADDAYDAATSAAAAAGTAAYAAATAADSSAAYAADDAADSSAAYAADDASSADADAAAASSRENARVKQADKLLELLRAATRG